jgi:arylsulfatase A
MSIRLLIACLGVALASAAGAKPNVLVILVDDLGYECLGANGGKSYQTPVLDGLAAKGVRFTHCYAQPNCTPTRAQLMSGQSNVRNYVKFGYLDPEVTTFGNLFKQAGYATCVVGKWQLGHDKTDLPQHFGFDEHCLHHYLHTGGKDRYANPGMTYNGKVRQFKAGEYGPDLTNDYALDFITRHKAEPWLLYYPMILTHAPFEPTPDSPDYLGKAKDRGRQQHFADMVAYTDKLTGKLLAKLDELGLRENTLILITGDNGTGKGIVSATEEKDEVEGGKASTAVADMHVPLIANWPAKMPTGRMCGDLVDMTDFLPTICEAASVPIPGDLKIDGHSFLPQLHGGAGRPREWIYSFWAPLRPTQTAKVGKRGAVEQAFDHDYKLYSIGEFYDLRSDPEEKHALKIADLTGDAVAGAKKLQAALDQFADARPANLQLISPGVEAAKAKESGATIEVAKGKKGKRQARKQQAPTPPKP